MLAMYLPPGSSASAAAIYGPAAHRALAEYPNAHRVVVVRDASPFVQLGMLRHELEHARQVGLGPAVFGVQIPLRDALGRTIGGGGSALMYKVIPHEHDADVAATALVGRELGAVPAELLVTTHRALLTTVPDPVVDAHTLQLRATALAAILGDEFQRECGRCFVGADELVTELTGLDWKRVRSVPAASETLAQVLEESPDNEAIASLPAAERWKAWIPAAEQLTAGIGRVAAELDPS
jgi:hypothetical protein